MNIICPPKWIRSLFPYTIWEIKNTNKVIYLTFDDGPIPEITPWVLDVLREFSAKATFFCVAHNIDKHPQIYQSIINDEHEVGNHTYNHLKGLFTNNKSFYKNISKAEQLIKSKLFRPPHGLISPLQCHYIGRKMGYKLIMWDVLTCDYDNTITADECLQNAISYTKDGSIVVFHDSIKAKVNLTYTLPKFLEHYSKNGYTFESLKLK